MHYHVHLKWLTIIYIQARTQTFEKVGANFNYFRQGEGSNHKKIPIFRPELGVYTDFLVKHCMVLI